MLIKIIDTKENKVFIVQQRTAKKKQTNKERQKRKKKKRIEYKKIWVWFTSSERHIWFLNSIKR